MLFKIGEGKDPMERAKDEQDWNHEGARLLENHEPGFVEVLSDTPTDIEKGIVTLIDLILQHSCDYVVGLVKKELELLSEKHEAQINNQ